MERIELYSANVCPYAHRTRLVLLEKGIDFDSIAIDLNNKPAGFAEVSPYLKVPALKYKSDRVWESAVINEYLEEVFPDPPLMPADPGKRALARIWIDFANTKFTVSFYKLLLAQDPQEQQHWREEFLSQLRFAETEGIGKLSTDEGPYWLGSSVSLIDLTFYPWFERWPVLTYYRNVEFPEECVRLKQWWVAMESRPSANAIRNSTGFYLKDYEKYANGTAEGISAREMRQV